MWFYSLIFFLVAGIQAAGYFFKYPKLSFWSCIVLLILVAAFRPVSSNKDQNTYIEYYRDIKDIPLSFLEPTYFVFAEISRVIFNSPIGIFILYSILGVSLKGLALTRLTKYYSVSLILYCGSFFLLHEMTQIRVGVASAILLLGIPSIANKNKKEFIFYWILGSLFHYSFMIFGLFYFLDGDKINPKFYVGMILASIGAAILGLNLVWFFQFVNLGFISEKINTYKALLDEGMYADIQLLNPLLILRIIILGVMLYKAKLLRERNQYALVLIKIYAFSIFFFIALSDLPTLAGRLNQLFGVVEIVVVPFLIYILTPKYCAVIFSILFGMLILYKQLYYSDLIFDYF